jgi:hypothetical protein
MTVRTAAALLILIFTFGFVLALLLQGYDLATALLGAGATGVVAAQIAHRLLGGSTLGARKGNESTQVSESSMVEPGRSAPGGVSGGDA